MALMADREGDRELVARARAGERDAFDQLAARYQRRLYRLVLRLLNDPAEAEDVVQETLIRAFRAIRGFRGEAAFYTWLFRIAVNVARSALVQRARRRSPGQVPPAPPGRPIDEERLPDIATPESVLASKEIADTVNAAMDALPIDLRTAIALREIEGLSYEEIADVMSCPIGTVRSRIYRAREAIAARLRPLLDLPVDKRW